MVLACRPGLGDFFLKAGLVDEVIEINKRSGPGRKLSLQKILDRKWDVVFVPHESVRTALWMTRVRSTRGKIGFRKWWNAWVYKYRVFKPMDYPDAIRQLSLLTPLDQNLAEKFGETDFSRLRSPLSQASPLDLREPGIPEWAAMTVKKNRPTGRRVFLAPGSVWPTKRWTAQGYEDLARLLLRRGFAVELVGSPPEKDLCDEIARKVSGVVNHAGATSLAELVELFVGGSVLVCNDSGAMHAAAVADLPTVAIFGPTVLAQGFRPWQNRAFVVQRELGCRLCGKHGAKKCPIGTHECMEKISAADVLATVEKIVSLGI